MEDWEQHCKTIFDLPATEPQPIIPNPTQLPFKAPEVPAALHAFKGNKVSGLSCLPTQVIKHMHSSNDEVIS